jgi:hypothetical protein
MKFFVIGIIRFLYVGITGFPALLVFLLYNAGGGDPGSQIEHKYHSARQVKETEIAKLDALIEAKKAILEQDNATCQFLKGIIENLSKMHQIQQKG